MPKKPLSDREKEYTYVKRKREKENEKKGSGNSNLEKLFRVICSKSHIFSPVFHPNVEFEKVTSRRRGNDDEPFAGVWGAAVGIGYDNVLGDFLLTLFFISFHFYFRR